MWLLNLFKSKKRRHLEDLENVIKIYTEILEMIERKKENTANGKILDFDFFNSEKDKLLIMNYVKYGVLDPLDKDTKSKVIRVFYSDCGDENYSWDLESAYEQVEQFVNSLKDEVIQINNN